MRGFRILVVEDDSEALAQTLQLLKEAILDSEIETAESVLGAIRLIERSAKAGELYDLAILDFKLPQEAGEHDTIDESICRYLGERMPSTVIGHMSGWLADPQILAHIARDHEGRSLGFILDKKGPDFGTHLIEKARQAVYGSRIERRIQEVFRPSAKPRPGGSEVRTSEPGMTGSATNRVMELCLEVADVWKDLGPSTKSIVKKFLQVESVDSGVTVVKR